MNATSANSNNFEQHQVPPDYLIQIGRVSVFWSTLESIFDLSLMKLAGMSIGDPRAWSIFAHMTFPLKLDIFGSLVTELQPKYPNLKELPSVIAKIKIAQQGRNMIVHAKWGIDEQGRVVISRITARGTIKTSVRAIPLSEVSDIVVHIEAAMKGLYEFVAVRGDKNPAY